MRYLRTTTLILALASLQFCLNSNQLKAQLWSDSIPTGGGFYFDWIGLFSPIDGLGNGWVYHVDHDWLYAVSDNAGGAWIYDLEMGWWWSSGDFYPFLWSNYAFSWVFYAEDSANPRLFFNNVTEEFESFPFTRSGEAPPIWLSRSILLEVGDQPDGAEYNFANWSFLSTLEGVYVLFAVSDKDVNTVDAFQGYRLVLYDHDMARVCEKQFPFSLSIIRSRSEGGIILRNPNPDGVVMAMDTNCEILAEVDPGDLIEDLRGRMPPADWAYQSDEFAMSFESERPEGAFSNVAEYLVVWFDEDLNVKNWFFYDTASRNIDSARYGMNNSNKAFASPLFPVEFDYTGRGGLFFFLLDGEGNEVSSYESPPAFQNDGINDYYHNSDAGYIVDRYFTSSTRFDVDIVKIDMSSGAKMELALQNQAPTVYALDQNNAGETIVLFESAGEKLEIIDENGVSISSVDFDIFEVFPDLAGTDVRTALVEIDVKPNGAVEFTVTNGSTFASTVMSKDEFDEKFRDVPDPLSIEGTFQAPDTPGFDTVTRLWFHTVGGVHYEFYHAKVTNSANPIQIENWTVYSFNYSLSEANVLSVTPRNVYFWDVLENTSQGGPGLPPSSSATLQPTGDGGFIITETNTQMSPSSLPSMPPGLRSQLPF